MGKGQDQGWSAGQARLERGTRVCQDGCLEEGVQKRHLGGHALVRSSGGDDLPSERKVRALFEWSLHLPRRYQPAAPYLSKASSSPLVKHSLKPPLLQCYP